MNYTVCNVSAQNVIVQASSVGGRKNSVSTDYVLKVLGLDVCSDTIVGNDMLRGVSGGQRKRVTTGLSLSLCLFVNSLIHIFHFRRFKCC